MKLTSPAGFNSGGGDIMYTYVGKLSGYIISLL